MPQKGGEQGDYRKAEQELQKGGEQGDYRKAEQELLPSGLAVQT